jgi:hypothetical protein
MGHTKKNIFKKGLVVKIPTKTTAIVSQSWLDADFYIVRFEFLRKLHNIKLSRFYDSS